jgi:phosphatidylglycerol lysyltransferase
MSETEMATEDRAQNRVAQFVVGLIEPRVIGPLVGAGLVVIALLVIHQISGRVHLHRIYAAIAATTPAAIAQALALTVVSFGAMAIYDIMAAQRVAPDRISHRLAAFAGLVGYGISNAIGFNVLIGGPVRYRIYQSAGLDASDVGRIVGISFLTFGSGIVALAGFALVVDPAGAPFLQAISPSADRLVGVAILLAVGALLVWLSRGEREVGMFGWRLPLPSAGSALAQIVVGAVDIGTAAGALYVLLPADIAPGFVVFLLLFVAAIMAGLVSHAPGGLGVLEATILVGLGAGTRPDVMAALIVFRLIYYVVPLLLAGAALLVFEAYRARRSVIALSGRALTRRVIAPLSAALVFLGGIVLLLSGNLPALDDRIGFLSDILPLPFAEASHLLASLVGLLLIVLSRGLYRRIALARVASIALLVAGAGFSLLKGLDWEEATVLIVVAGALLANPRAFYRKGDWRSFRPTPTWLAFIVIVLALLTLVGFLAYRHVDYESDLWWEFAWDGNAPRFLRATLALTVLAAAIALDSLIHRPRLKRIGRVAIPPAVRRIIDASSDTSANVALLGDKRFIVSSDEKAFLMYAVAGHSWVTMGDPVGEPDAARSLIWQFAEAADHAGVRCVFYGITPDLLGTYLDLGLAILKTGEVARVDLQKFTLAGSAREDFRYADKRATREGLEFSIVPQCEVAAIMPQLRAVSDAWLARKAGHEKGFSLGRFDEEYVGAFDCAIIRKDSEIVAFANLWRSADKIELSVDLMRYRPGISKVMMDALFARILLYGKAENYRWFNLGAAPLAGLADHPLASTWNRLGTFIYRRGEEFYNFEGLRAFKQKFDPVWTSQYMACPNGLAMPQVLLDVTNLISGNPIRILRK